MWLVKLATRNWMTRTATVLGFSILSIYGAVLLFPKMEYLPQGNRNLIINILIRVFLLTKEKPLASISIK